MTGSDQASALIFPRTFGDNAVTDPHPVYGTFREAGPVHYTEVVDGCKVWVVTRFEDVQAVLDDPARLSSNPRFGPQEWLDQFGLLRDENGKFIVAENMLYADPPLHTRLRKLVSKAFTPRRIQQLAPYITSLCEQVLDDLAAKGRAELIYDYAYLIPLTVISELLGMPEADRERFQTVSNLIMVGRPVDPEQVTAAQWELIGMIGALVSAKRENPADDLLTALIAARDEDDKLDELELISMAGLLIIAGQETTGNLIGNALLELISHPERLDELRRDPSGWPRAVDELLRLQSPALGTWRFALEDVEIAGTTIPAGQAVLALLASADRDPRHFDDPESYDPHHARPGHLVFGHGIHHCLGVSLARLEAEIALTALASRLTDIKLAVPAGQLRWRPSLMRGLIELPVTFTATAR
ncbi:MAG TPA: cytochrome P450 [Streptosporangiaceae bacterium]|nr:cytochrome P450 [Streptosporangiaceae bacterium]